MLPGCGSVEQTDNSAAQEENTATPNAEDTHNATGEEHEAITMTAMVPFRNPSHLTDLVHEKYPEINIEFIPYSGYNGTAFVKEELAVDDMPDIYLGSMYLPARDDVSDKLIDLSVYAFTDNFTDYRLREVTDNGSIYMLPLYYSCMAITYNKTLLEENGWERLHSLQRNRHRMNSVICRSCQRTEAVMRILPMFRNISASTKSWKKRAMNRSWKMLFM